ncbi:MAG: hypothetical protein CMJ59_25815 [Planctomycetaceae bacterium]|nr:hypothetical protein [Planctomycetaceae bacterium]
MVRAFFVALGLSLSIVGAESLLVEKAVLRETTAVVKPSLLGPKVNFQQQEWNPPIWMRWGMLSTGTLVVMYSFTLPGRLDL